METVLGGRPPPRTGAAPGLGAADHGLGLPLLRLPGADSLSLTPPASGFGFISGTPVVGVLHGPDRYLYCPHCKTWLTTHARNMEDMVNLRPSTLDDHRWFAPFIEEATADKLPWASTSAPHSFETGPSGEEFDRIVADFAKNGARPS